MNSTVKNFINKLALGFERSSNNITRWIGSISSVIIHTILFVVAFVLCFLGVNLDKILLVVTTIVSLEAIYLAIFIQMSVNRQSYNLGKVASDIDEIQEDIDEIQEDIEEVGEEMVLEKIEFTLENLIREVAELKKQHKNTQNKKETENEQV
jgi:low affinity Fe/Cu permease